MKKPIIISLVNGKGGVGKTATSINLSAGLTLQNKKVLVLDIDKQGNTSKHFKVYDPQKPSIVDVIMNGADPHQAIRKTEFKNLDVIPSCYELEDVPDKILLDINKSREKRLLSIKDLDYDFIIIDCPPDLGIVTINSLVISDYVIVPCEADMWSLEGFEKITAKIDMVRDNHNEKLKLLGVLVTKDNNSATSNEVKQLLKQTFGEKFFGTSIRYSKLFAKSTFNLKPIIISHPKSTVSEDYTKLVSEVLEYAK